MTVCSWCNEIIERPALARPIQVVSHGICRQCLSRELARLRDRGSAELALDACAVLRGLARVRRPLRVYALLELGIGAFARFEPRAVKLL